MLLQANDISVNFGEHQVLEDVNLKITSQSRIGLIGANGAGKSTLMKCLMAEIIPQGGSISRADNLKVQCLTQNPRLTVGNTLEEELYSVFKEIDSLKLREKHLNEMLSSLAGEELEQALQDIANIHQELDHLGASSLEAKIGKMVTGLGFSLDELKQPVEKFSGGWQMRINLAKVLLQEADVLLMDEPTNHLDMQACEWLEDFLRNYPKGIVVISHDRRFLDEVVTEIAELERGSLTLYKGNYRKYVQEREVRREQQAAASQRQKKHMDEQMAFVDRFRAKATKSKQAKSREKQLSKIELIEAPSSELKRLKFKFPLVNPSGTQVLEIANLAKSFSNKDLFNNVSAKLEWTKDEPQRVFILGENGCGKTTLFKILMGLEDATGGEIKFGHRVELGYYAQHQLQILDPNKTVLSTLEDVMPPTPQGEIRGILGRFLFSADQVFKQVEVLSGGEKARLAIAKLMVGGPNTLLLDEPTNHLDIDAQEAVENVIRDFGGTVICISHDRYLIQNHATQIWEFTNGSLNVYKGDYEYYLENRKLSTGDQNTKQETKVSKVDPNKSFKEAKQRDKQLKTLERELSKLNKKKEVISQKLEDPDLASDYKELEKLNAELEALSQDISEKEMEWIELAE